MFVSVRLLVKCSVVVTQTALSSGDNQLIIPAGFHSKCKFLESERCASKLRGIADWLAAYALGD